MQENSKTQITPRIFTIGVYGFTSESFFSAIRKFDVDVFCDIRLRRGLRGADYSFANSTSLQKQLSEMNIKYVHLKNLAPTQEIREIQKNFDKENNIFKHYRENLTNNFINAYKHQCLSSLDIGDLINQIGHNTRNILLFCVEREASACHRSICAEWFATKLCTTIEHIKP